MPRGFSGVKQASADVESRRGSGTGPGPLYFRLQAGEEAIVRFLEQDEDIFWAMMHEVPVEGRQWGKNVPCLDQDKDGTPCPGCERDMDRRFKGFINVIWFNAPVFKRDGENKIVKGNDNKPIVVGEKPQVAVWNSGIRLFEELDEMNANWKGLTKRRFKVKRRGSGLDTKYTIVPEDIEGGQQEFTDEEKKLAADKYDLSLFTNPGTYDDFMRDLGQGGGGGYRQENQGPVNPFMRSRS